MMADPVSFLFMNLLGIKHSKPTYIEAEIGIHAQESGGKRPPGSGRTTQGTKVPIPQCCSCFQEQTTQGQEMLFILSLDSIGALYHKDFLLCIEFGHNTGPPFITTKTKPSRIFHW